MDCHRSGGNQIDEMNGQQNDTVGTTPKTVGALLAEEWMIDPLSALPSFLEMIWIQEVDRSTQQGLISGVDYLRQTLEEEERQQHQQGQLLQNHLFPLEDVNRAEEEEVTNTVPWSLKIRRVVETIKRKCTTLGKRIMQKYRNEIIAVIIYAMERESLSRTNATIAEAMYGGHRVQAISTNPKARKTDQPNSQRQPQQDMKTSRTSKLEPLNVTAMTRLALLKAFVPYMKSKLDSLLVLSRQNQHYIQRPRSQQQPQPQLHRVVFYVERMLLFLYPYLRATVQGLDLLCHWKFLTGQSFHYDLISLLLGQIVRRVTVQDQPNTTVAPIESSTIPTASSSTTSSASASSERGALITGSGKTSSSGDMTASAWLQTSIASGTLLVCVVSWAAWARAEWDRMLREEQVRCSSPLGPVPPPPPPPPTLASTVGAPGQDDGDTCPFCHTTPRQSPTASNSGYVFCWTCIQGHVSRSQTCPVTGQICTEGQLVRLYEPRLTFVSSSRNDRPPPHSVP